MHKLTQPNLSDPQTLYASLVEQCTGLEIPCAPTLSEHTERFDLVVDGLFGFNLDSSRVLSDEYKHALCLLHSTYAATVSIDLPSGWLCELLSESDAEKHNRAMQCGKETDPKCLEWQPTMVVSLSAIKECMVRFKGIEYVGGRFVPPVLAKELGIRIPTYPASAQFVKLHDKRN